MTVKLGKGVPRTVSRHQNKNTTMPFQAAMTLNARSAQRPKARRTPRDSRLLRSVSTFWRDFIDAAFNPYRPEDHYMRGPGPAWHAKNGSMTFD